MKKQFTSMLLAVIMAFSLASTTVFAAGINNASPEVHTLTINGEDLFAYAAESSMTKSPSQNLGLALEAGASGWSVPVNVLFTTLPANATVQSLKIVPGKATINNGHTQMLGAVVISKVKITAPNQDNEEITWGNTMTTSLFNGYIAKGTWQLQCYGKNLTNPTGDYVEDLRRFGSTIYKSLKVTITYTT